MSQPLADAQKAPAEAAAPKQGFSQFLSRVLDQLSLSAWLPAAMLVGSLAVLLQVHARPDRSLALAVNDLIAKPLGVIVLLLFALVLATMVTQAFEFEVIRLLEGYWGSSPLARGLGHVFIGRQQRRLRSLKDQRDALTLRAFRESRLVERGLIPDDKTFIVEIIDAELQGLRPEPLGWRARRRAAEALIYDWRPYAPPEIMRRLDAVESRIDGFPRDHRLLPTALGNTLRSIEDSLVESGVQDLEGFIIRRWDVMSAGLRQEHDQYRTRLDMYCTLVFVFGALSVLAPALITHGKDHIVVTVLTSAAYALMSCVSYAAAIASARGYGVVLVALLGPDDRSVPAAPPLRRLMTRIGQLASPST